MKGLAEFVMRGRLQALLVTVAGAGSLLFCWISAAALALVTLRKGAGSGAWLFMWALLPAGTLLYVFGDSGPLALLAGTMVLALVLRATVNLPLAVLAGVGVGVATGLAMLAFSGAYLDQLVDLLRRVSGQYGATVVQGWASGGVAQARRGADSRNAGCGNCHDVGAVPVAGALLAGGPV